MTPLVRSSSPLAVFALAMWLWLPGCATGGVDDQDGGMIRPDTGPVDAQVITGDGGDCEMTCPAENICRAGMCVPRCGPDRPCAAGRQCCDGACVDVQSTATDCGACGIACGTTTDRCTTGTCRCGTGMACPAGALCCPGGCVDPQTNASNCGACGNACGEGQACVGGSCVTPTCTPACAAGETCTVGGVCQCGEGAPCTGGTRCCGDACIDVQTDRNNCGGCGIACSATQSCTAGTCMETPCSPACGPGETCMGGACRCGGGAGCSAGTACCGSGAAASCVRLDTVGNCGACGRTCGGSEQCCDGNCVNTQTSRSHCGRCGSSCGNTADGCTSGSCTCGGAPACFLVPCFFGTCPL